MHAVLIVIISCFFVLMSVWLIVAIVQGIYYVIFQRTNKIHLSLFTRCEMQNLYYYLEHKGARVDVALAHTRYNGYYYVVGLKGIYKINFVKFIKVAEEDLQQNELVVVQQLRKESYARALEEQMIINCFCDQYRQ